MNREEYRFECEVCKRNGDEWVTRGSNYNDTKELFKLHLEKVHGIKKGCGVQTGKRVSGRWLNCGEREEDNLPMILCEKCRLEDKKEQGEKDVKK